MDWAERQKEIDLDNVKQVINLIEDFFQNYGKVYDENMFNDVVLLLVEIGNLFWVTSYRQGSVKERWRDFPWHHLEWIKMIFEKCKENYDLGLDDEIELHRIALPLIYNVDLDELLGRLKLVIDVFENQDSYKKIKDNSIITEHPIRGLFYIRKLIGYYIDDEQLRVSNIYLHEYLLNVNEDVEDVDIHALFRVLIVTGESCKYLSEYSRDQCPNLAWKNLEKIRDLLSHMSSIPIRKGILSLTKNEEVQIEGREFKSHKPQDKTVHDTFEKKKNGNWKIFSLFILLLTFSLYFGIIYSAVLLPLMFGYYHFYMRETENILEMQNLLQGYIYPFPENCLKDLIKSDLVDLQKAIINIQSKRKALKRSKYQRVFASSSILVLFTFLLDAKYFFFVNLANILIFLGSCFYLSRKSEYRNVWDNIPDPKHPWKTDHLPEKEEIEDVKVDEIEELLLRVDKDRQSDFRKIFLKQVELTREDKGYLFSKLSKDEKKLAASILFGERNSQKNIKAVSTSTKEERVMRAFNTHKNSTLNKERGMMNVIKMRRYLQNPSVMKYDYEKLSLDFAIEEIEYIISLSSKGIYHLSPIERFALEYHLGVYSLQASQLIEYIENFIHYNYGEYRDYYLHGIGHSFHTHTTELGLNNLETHVSHLTHIIHPYLLAIKEQNT